MDNPTWIEIARQSYGAQPDECGPIGGGIGYTRTVTGGDYTPRTLDELVAALARARKGETVVLDSGFDITTRVYAENLVLELREGVTLAGNRAEILSDGLHTWPMIRILGPNARVTGLRLRGPDSKHRPEHGERAQRMGGREYFFKFPIAVGIETAHDGLEVDNCELSAWSYAAIRLLGGHRHFIHHNFIHHNRLEGLGYGICLETASARITHNRFDANRHSIAGTGAPGSGYEAAHNVELGIAHGHCFDMHGGRDRGDGTEIAGDWMKIHHNTFCAPNHAVQIRGLPQQSAEVTGNWFAQDTPEKAVVHLGNTVVTNNVYSLITPRVH